jgi:RNA 2',3'-cyclic 3'-phosphodiesterase
MRTFIAIPLPDEIHQKLAELIRNVREQNNHFVRWVNAENIHLTLKFLGEVDSEKIPAITQSILETAQQSDPFDLQVKQTGAFPNLKRPRIFWVGVSQLEKLKTLQELLEIKMAKLGFEIEKRPFSPHLTLGRVNERASHEELESTVKKISSLETVDLGIVHVDTIKLFKSELSSKGSLYTPLFTAKLSKLEP